MAMPSGNGAVSEKMHTQNGNGGSAGGGAEAFHHLQHRQWSPDDGFISWLRSEFAAANAIIDSLCHHLRSIGEPGEYDGVIWSIQQRRSNWNPVLHMQAYVSVNDVAGALQQVSWLKQQQFFEPVKAPPKDFRRNNSGYRVKQRVESAKDSRQSSMDCGSSKETSNSVNPQRGEFVKLGDKLELPGDKRGSAGNIQADGCIKENSHGTVCSESVHEVESPNDRTTADSKGCHDLLVENNSNSIRNPHEKKKIDVTSKTFVATEMLDGKEVNVVDGMKLYDRLLDTSEVSNLVSLVNEIRVSGKRGKLQGPTLLVLKRPMNGHGREVIQFGLPIADVPPEDESAMGAFPERRVESIPHSLQNLIEDLVGSQIMTVKPDSCVVNIFNEGDYSHPHMWPAWFGRPVYLLSLTESDVTFGKLFAADVRGNFKGSLKLSLAPGSLLAMEGRSADFAKHAVPAVQKQRIIITFAKSKPRKTALHTPSPSQWGPPSNIRLPNHLRHSLPKHYSIVPTTSAGVLTPPPAHPFLPPNTIQPPLFVAAAAAAVTVMPTAAPLPLPPAATSTGWQVPAPPPRPHQPLRPPVPGTGVFLPPGSEGGKSARVSVAAHPPVGTSNASPKGNEDENAPPQDCNGSKAETGKAKEELQSNGDGEAAVIVL